MKYENKDLRLCQLYKYQDENQDHRFSQSTFQFDVRERERDGWIDMQRDNEEEEKGDEE